MKAGKRFRSRSFSGILAAGLLAFSAGVQANPTIAFVPTGSTGPFTVNGNEIIVPAGGVQVEIEVVISGWAAAPGAPLLGAYNATLVGTSLEGVNANPSQPGVNLITPTQVDCASAADCGTPSPPPVTTTGTCGIFQGGKCDDFQPAFTVQKRCFVDASVICAVNGDCGAQVPALCIEDSGFVMGGGGLSPVVAVSIPANNSIEWIAAASAGGSLDGVGHTSAGFLRLIVPGNGKGSWTISWDPDGEKSFLNDQDGLAIPGVTLVDGTVTIETGSCCSPLGPDVQCFDGDTVTACNARPDPRLFRPGVSCADEVCASCRIDSDCADPVAGQTGNDNLCTSNACDSAPGVCSNTSLFDATVDCCDPDVGVGSGLTPIDDADDCTTDACDPATGDVDHDVAAAGGLSCDDGFGCTVDDTCDGANSAANGGCAGTDANTLPCQTTGDCQVGECNAATGLCECAAEAPLPAASPHDRLKNRAISINPNNTNPVVMKVELLDNACSSTGQKCTNDVDCKTCVGGANAGLGCLIDLDCPGGGSCTVSGETCDEQSAPIMLGWVGDPITLGAASQLPAGTTVSRVVKDMPALRVWPEAIVHVSDCEIAAVQSYRISASADGVSFSEPLDIGTVIKPSGKAWGDYVGSAALGVFTPPNGIVNVEDLVALILFFLGRTASDPEYVVTTLELVDETTTFVISASDLQAWLGAFRGDTYPPPSFGNQGGPADCP